MIIGLNDAMPFGKYKEGKVADLLLNDPGYLCWLREQRRKAAQDRVFSHEVSILLDEAIRNDKDLQKRYTPLGEPADVEAILKGRTAMIEESEKVVERNFAVRKAAYQEQWGAW